MTDTPATISPDDIVGAAEIAQRLTLTSDRPVARDTVNTWNKRRKAWVADGRPGGRRARDEPMPDPLTRSDGTPVTVSGEPVWAWPDIAAWVGRIGRYRASDT